MKPYGSISPYKNYLNSSEAGISLEQSNYMGQEFLIGSGLDTSE